MPKRFTDHFKKVTIECVLKNVQKVFKKFAVTIASYERQKHLKSVQKTFGRFQFFGNQGIKSVQKVKASKTSFDAKNLRYNAWLRVSKISLYINKGEELGRSSPYLFSSPFFPFPSPPSTRPGGQTK